jgi:hypothetical protein
MRRLRIERPKRRRKPWWLEVMSIDRCDPDVLRVKSHGAVTRHDTSRSPR